MAIASMPAARGAPAAAAGKKAASRSADALSRALVRALGEYAAFTASARAPGRPKRRRGAAERPGAAEERQAVLAWLRSLRADELASLCSVVDVGFVKTMLSMAMVAAKRGKSRAPTGHHGGARVVEFQLLPSMLPRGKSASIRRGASSEAAKASQPSAPREFVARPVVQTADGDSFGAFHTREYEDAVLTISKSLRFFNTLKSCDTVSLSLVHLGILSSDLTASATTSNVDELARLFAVMSRGGFLWECPPDATLADQMWGETKWLSTQGYYSLEALIVNQIELNIWAQWKAVRKIAASDSASGAYPSITLVGPSSKLYLAREWQHASKSDRQRIVLELHGRAVEHLLNSEQSVGSHRVYQGVKASLDNLIDVLGMGESGEARGRTTGASVLVERYFGCTLEQIVTSPQAAALKLLIAEHFQASCSVLLSDRMTNEVAAGIGRETTARSEVDSLQAPNHLQRRRASRKKALKQRRQHSLMKAAQQRQLKLVLEELRSHVRRRKEEALQVASGLIHEVIGRAADEAAGGEHELSAPGTNESPATLSHEPVKVKSRKKKKSKKKKTTKQAPKTLQLEATGNDASELDEDTPEMETSSADSTHLAKENMASQDSGSRLDDGGSLDRMHSASGEQKFHQPGFLYSSTTTETRPFLGFLSSVNVSSSLSHFTPRSLYPSTPSPFFSSLALKDREGFVADVAVVGGHLAADESEKALSDESSDSLGNESPSISEKSSFEWYLPSMFSTPSTLDRKQSGASPLDWNFYNYRWPLKAGVNREESSDGDQSSATSEVDRSPVTHLDCEDNGVHGTAGTPAYPLRSFADMTAEEPDLTPKQRTLVVDDGDADNDENHKGNQDEVGSAVLESTAKNPDNKNSLLSGAARSDFLYRKGGFFDRQRALKRRRHPVPIDGNDGSAEDLAVAQNSNVGAGVSIPTVYEDDGEHPERSDGCRRCCACSCHRRTASGDTDLSLDSNHDVGEASGDSSLRNDLDETRSKLAAVLERVSNLEKDFTDQIARADKAASDARKEASGLQQTVSALSAQLQAAESEIRQLHSTCRAPVSGNAFDVDGQASTLMDECGVASGLEVSATSSISSPDPSYSPAPSSDSHLSDGSPVAGAANTTAAAAAAARMMGYNYSQSLVSHAVVAPSVMGPFVSVPMSVLPPRSKLHWDMCEFVSQLQTESNARLPAQMEAQRLCTATVQSLWPRAQVRPYGSYVTRLVLPSSDLDLVICLPKVRRDAPADTAGVLEGRNAIKETWQQNLARKLRQEPWVVPDSVKTLPHASVPIITLLTAPPYNVRLDISFEGPGHNGLATNDVVLSLIHEFPPLAPIMLVLKSFAIERGFAVAYSGGLSSYALLLMVARYLQEYNDTLPSGFENVSAAVQHSISAQSAADFGMMLMGFLDFYGNRFDPRTTGISVASRCFLNRESMSPTSSSSSSSASASSMPVAATNDGQNHLHSSEDAGSGANSMDERGVNAYNSTHWQNPQPPPSDLLSSPGSRRYGYRSSLDWPQNPSSTGGIMTMMMRGEFYPQNTHVDPHKFDPVFIEDPLRPTNNVGRNCFRIMQIRRAFAAAHSSLLLASRSSSIFSENRSALVSGVALHPDNLLRAILGANAPVNIKSETSMTPSADGNTTQSPTGASRQTPHSMRQNYMRFQQFAASTNAVAAANERGMLQYGDPQVAATHYFGGEHAYPVTQQELHSATHLHHHYQYPPFYRAGQHHQAHSNGSHYNQQSHHHHHVQPYMVDQSTGRMVSASSTHYYDYSPPHRANDKSNRRYSESESERMTTRSVTSADQYERVSRRERSVGSPRRKTRSTATSQRSLGAVSSSGALARDDHASAGRQHSSGGDTQPIATRKSPARSLSFADVVVGGGGGSNNTRRDSLHLAGLQRKNPTSPLALARQGRFWRDDSAINDSISEKWETKDDSQLK